MRVGIDARMIDWSGIGRYTENLITGIEEFDKDIDVDLFCNQNNAQRIPENSPFKRHYINTPILSLNAPVKLASKLKQHELDLYHAPHFVVPAGKVAYPLVVTIHDLIPLIIPQTMPNALHRRYYHLLNQSAVRKAAKIIVPSQSTKNDVVKMFNAPEDKVEVVYCVQDDLFKRAGEKQIIDVKDKFAIKGEYIFALGNQKPNKGLEYLLDAFHKLKRERELRYTLIFTGEPSSKFPNVTKRIAKYGLQDEARFVGKLNDDELVALYSGASVFVFPSLYEGFGLPPLEAMACEVPVIASNRSSVPEVVGDAAVTVDPCNVDEFANAIDMAIEDKKLRSDLIQKGLNRLNNFSLEKFTKETIGVYKSALGSKTD